jgi:hypothetical protein
MARNVFKVTGGIENSMSLVSATVQVSVIECISQVDYGPPKLLSVSIQMILMTTSLFATVIQFAIKVAREVPAQAVKPAD